VRPRPITGQQNGHPPRPPPRRQSMHGLMDVRAGFTDPPPYWG
jgi:hypothetical protein